MVRRQYELNFLGFVIRCMRLICIRSVEQQPSIFIVGILNAKHIETDAHLFFFIYVAVIIIIILLLLCTRWWTIKWITIWQWTTQICSTFHLLFRCIKFTSLFSWPSVSWALSAAFICIINSLVLWSFVSIVVRSLLCSSHKVTGVYFFCICVRVCFGLLLFHNSVAVRTFILEQTQTDDGNVLDALFVELTSIKFYWKRVLQTVWIKRWKGIKPKQRWNIFVSCLYIFLFSLHTWFVERKIPKQSKFNSMEKLIFKQKQNLY